MCWCVCVNFRLLAAPYSPKNTVYMWIYESSKIHTRLEVRFYCNQFLNKSLGTAPFSNFFLFLLKTLFFFRLLLPQPRPWISSRKWMDGRFDSFCKWIIKHSSFSDRFQPCSKGCNHFKYKKGKKNLIFCLGNVFLFFYEFTFEAFLKCQFFYWTNVVVFVLLFFLLAHNVNHENARLCNRKVVYIWHVDTVTFMSQTGYRCWKFSVHF